MDLHESSLVNSDALSFAWHIKMLITFRLLRLGRIKLCNVNVRDKIRSPKIRVIETWNLFLQSQSSRTNYLVNYRGTQALNSALRHAHCNTRHAGPCVPASTLATFTLSYCLFTCLSMLYLLTASLAGSQTIILQFDVRAGGQNRISAFFCFNHAHPTFLTNRTRI